ncbi:hypothetical protein D3C87_915410 [compost metagenome]
MLRHDVGMAGLARHDHAAQRRLGHALDQLPVERRQRQHVRHTRRLDQLRDPQRILMFILRRNA